MSAAAPSAVPWVVEGALRSIVTSPAKPTVFPVCCGVARTPDARPLSLVGNDAATRFEMVLIAIRMPAPKIVLLIEMIGVVCGGPTSPASAPNAVVKEMCGEKRQRCWRHQGRPNALTNSRKERP